VVKKKSLDIGKSLHNPITGDPILVANEHLSCKKMIIGALNGAAAMGEEDTIRIITLGQELYNLEDQCWVLAEPDFRLIQTCLQSSSRNYTLPAYGALLQILNEAEVIDG